MDIKATQLKNTRIDETVTSSVRTPVKVSEEGKTFIDEMIDLPKLETESNAKPKITSSEQSVQSKNEDVKSYEFVSRPQNDFAKTIKNEKLSVEERQAIHKAAEKELVDEIVLMNDKQNSQVKDFVKNDLNKAQVSVSQKSENQIKEEQKEITLDSKNNFENIKFVVPENIENEIIVPDKNIVEEIIGEPENLVKFSEADEPIVQNKVSMEIFEEPKFIENKEIKSEKSQIKVAEKFDMPKSAEHEEVKIEQPQIKVAEKFDMPKSAEHEEIKSEKQKYEKFNENKIEDIKLPQVEENEIFKAVQDNEKPEKPLFVEDLINNSKIDEKSDNKTNKSIINKVTNVKSEILNEPENIGRVKDISDDINVKSIDVKPVIPENIKVIKMEVPNPLADLNNSLNTTKTSDIVKFIDANLSTASAKSSKNNAAKKTENVKKSASEKSIKMTEADAKFFNNLIDSNQQVIEGTKTSEQINNNVLKDIESAKSAQVSKTLLNALKESQETNKPFRLDFDKDISIILRVNKNGTISAEFLPGDEAVEQYLKANIPLLKQKFSDEGLEYDNLSYRQNRKENNEERERHNRGNKKENGYE